MRNARFVPVLIVTFLVCFACQQDNSAIIDARLQRVENGLIPENYAENDSVFSIQERMAQYHVPGVSIAVIHDFEIEWAKAYGVRDADEGDPVTERTLFQAASISKPVAAMAALRFAQDGKLDIDENINNYLTSWKLPENEFTEGNPVTASHLMSHSGGLTVHGFRGYKASEPQPTVPQILDGEKPANSAPVRVDMAPGTKFRYSGGGYTILQQALVDIAGKEFPAIMAETVLRPAGMEHSTYEQPVPDGLLQFASVGHMTNGDPVLEKRHIYPEMAAAGLWTTPSDLAKFAIEVQLSIQGKSNKILNRETAKRMVTAFADSVYGLGFNISREGYFSHGGSNQGFRCILVANLEGGYGAAVMTNGSNRFIYGEIVRAIAKEYNWENFLDERN